MAPMKVNEMVKEVITGSKRGRQQVFPNLMESKLNFQGKYSQDEISKDGRRLWGLPA